METIPFEDFTKLEIRIGKILAAEKIEGSDKLLKLSVDFGPTPLQIKDVEGWVEPQMEDMGDGEAKPTVIPGRITRQIIAGIAQYYAPEALIGKECPFAYNLAPRMLKGLESQGMILCPSDKGGPVLLHPDKEIEPGSLVK